MLIGDTRLQKITLLLWAFVVINVKIVAQICEK